LLAGALVTAALAAFGQVEASDFFEMPGAPESVTALLVVVLAGGFGEEAGWRAYAWPRLRARLCLRDAALVLTVPWALWHLPLFWLDSGLADLPLLVVPGWLLGLASGAVVLGWLYERSGSVAVVAVAHSCVNLVSATHGGEGLPAAAVSALVIVAAVLVLRAEGPQRPA
jgi:membrane protease YdiL (CAAX protease family)